MKGSKTNKPNSEVCEATDETLFCAVEGNSFRSALVDVTSNNVTEINLLSDTISREINDDRLSVRDVMQAMFGDGLQGYVKSPTTLEEFKARLDKRSFTKYVKDTAYRYKPVPEGLELFATEDDRGFGIRSLMRISEGDLLGRSTTNYGSATHFVMREEGKRGNLIRTPLGGFLNHSAVQVNCTLEEFDLYYRGEKDKVSTTQSTYYRLKAIKDIEPGEEILINYNDCPCHINN